MRAANGLGSPPRVLRDATRERAEAATWLGRWEVMMERYLPERRAVLDGVLDEVATRFPRPRRIIDLGSGPGFLALRAARRFPDAQVLAVDRDPVLVELGRRLGHPRVTWRCADLCGPGWTTAADEGVVDAVVSVMTLHMLDATAVEGLMAELAQTLRLGGLFVDHDEAGLDASVDATELAGQGTESWTGWWAAIAEDPALRTAFALRDASPPGPAADASRPLQRVAALRRAGFARTAAVRQPGGSHWRITARR